MATTQKVGRAQAATAVTPVARRQMRVSVILPVMDETASLRETVQIILEENFNTLEEILIIVCGKTTPAARGTALDLELRNPQRIHVREQRLPFLGGAMRDAFEWAQGTHVLMMASDLETDPRTVKDLIDTAAQGYDVVTATRWSSAGGFQGYSPIKFVLNWFFQRSFRLLYGTTLSDLTYGFRIFKSDLVKTIHWQELRHPFLLETILKPLRLGAKTKEIPTVWRTRTEGVSHNPFWRNFLYFRIALRTRLTPKRQIIKRS